MTIKAKPQGIRQRTVTGIFLLSPNLKIRGSHEFGGGGGGT
jgi:hypothetical protein